MPRGISRRPPRRTRRTDQPPPAIHGNAARVLDPAKTSRSPRLTRRSGAPRTGGATVMSASSRRPSRRRRPRRLEATDPAETGRSPRLTSDNLLPAELHCGDGKRRR
jgi:hypothetical protein